MNWESPSFRAGSSQGPPVASRTYWLTRVRHSALSSCSCLLWNLASIPMKPNGAASLCEIDVSYIFTRAVLRRTTPNSPNFLINGFQPTDISGSCMLDVITGSAAPLALIHSEVPSSCARAITATGLKSFSRSIRGLTERGDGTTHIAYSRVRVQVQLACLLDTG